MKRFSKISVIILSVLLAVACALCVGCGENASVTISLSKTSLSMQSVDSEMLVATVEGSEEDVIWASSNTAVATVNANGKVTAVGEGSAKITASVGDVKAECSVTVVLYSPVLTLDKTEVAIRETETATVTPATASHDREIAGVTYTFASDKESVATVSDAGVITGVSEGTAVITVTTNGLGEGKELSKTVNVTISAYTITFNVNRKVLNGDGEWVTDATDSVTCRPTTQDIMKALWSYKGLILNTEQYVENPDEEAFTSFDGIVANGETCDAYYSVALPVAGPEEKVFFFYIGGDNHVGSYGVNYEKLTEEFNGKTDVYKVNNTVAQNMFTTLVGVNPDDIQGKFNQLSFYIYEDNVDTTNAVLSINNVLASLQTSSDNARLAQWMTIYNANDQEVANVTSGAWYKVVINLQGINTRRETGVHGFALQIRSAANTSYYIQGATFTKIDTGNYVVEHYFVNDQGEYVLDEDYTDEGEAIAGIEFTAPVAMREGFTVNFNAEGTVKSAVIVKDQTTTLKLYYDKEVKVEIDCSVENVKLYTSTGGYFQNVGEFNGKTDVVSFTQTTRRDYLRICGITNDIAQNLGYKTFKFNLYVEDATTSNVVANLNNGGSLMSIWDFSNVKPSAEHLKFYDVEGKEIIKFASAQWITVVVDLTGISSNESLGRINFELGGEANAVFYFQGAELSTKAISDPVVVFGSDGNASGAVLGGIATIENIGKNGAVKNGDYDVYKHIATESNQYIRLDGMTSAQYADAGYKKVSLKIYITADVTVERIYGTLQYTGIDADGTIRLNSGNIGASASYPDVAHKIKMFDKDGNRVYDLAVGYEGWITLEVSLEGIADTATGVGFNLFITNNLANTTNSVNVGKPIYISEVKLSTESINVEKAYKVEYYFEGDNGYAIDDAKTENKTGYVDEEVTASKSFEGYIFNADESTAKGLLKKDTDLVLKLYYDKEEVKIVINCSEEGVKLFTSTGGTFENVGEFQGKTDVVSFTQKVSRDYLRICGITNTTAQGLGYKTFKFNLYVADASTSNVLAHLNNGVANLMSIWDYGNVKANAEHLKFYDADGKEIVKLASAQWVTVVVDLTGISSNETEKRINFELGADAVDTVFYFQGAELSTKAISDPVVVFGSDGNASGAVLGGIATIENIGKNGAVKNGDYDVYKHIATESNQYIRLDGMTCTQYAEAGYKKVSLKIYITADVTVERIYEQLQYTDVTIPSGGTIRLNGGNIGGISDKIRMFDKDGAKVTDLALGYEGWITLEVSLENIKDTATGVEFYIFITNNLANTTNSVNVGKPIYISEVKLSADALSDSLAK